MDIRRHNAPPTVRRTLFDGEVLMVGDGSQTNDRSDNNNLWKAR